MGSPVWVFSCKESLRPPRSFRFGINELTATSYSSWVNPQIISACAGILLLVGFWTPVVGSLIAVMELWVALTHTGDPWIPIVLATFGATSPMIGPGARSLDARLYGRKHIAT